MAIAVPATVNQAIAAVAGFTTPTFTVAATNTTFPNGKKYVVTGKGGTQPGTVDVHSASRPFDFLVTQPPVVQMLPAVNMQGVLPKVPYNNYGVSTRKGATPLAGQASVANQIKTTISIAAGTDLADPTNIAAMLIAHIQVLAQTVQGIYDTAVSGQT